MRTLIRMATVVGIAVALLLGSHVVVPDTSRAATLPSGSAAASTATDHYLRSGFLTVNGSAEVAQFSISNSLAQSLEVDLSLVDTKGNTVSSKKGLVAPNKSLTLSFDPKATTRVRAVFHTEGDASIECNGMAPNFELLRMINGVLRSVEVDGDFWHLDVPVG